MFYYVPKQGYWLYKTILESIHKCYRTITCRVLLNWPQLEVEKHDEIEATALHSFAQRVRLWVHALTDFHTLGDFFIIRLPPERTPHPITGKHRDSRDSIYECSLNVSTNTNKLIRQEFFNATFVLHLKLDIK